MYIKDMSISNSTHGETIMITVGALGFLHRMVLLVLGILLFLGLSKLKDFNHLLYVSFDS
jgi:tRNA U38,U39,U40 pseudouridine synthase TruA